MPDQQQASPSPKGQQAYKLKDKQNLDALDSTVACFLCCQNFWGEILKFSVVSYFFWVGCIYFIGSIILVTGFQYSVPRVGNIIACPMQTSVYTFVALWFFQSIIFFFTCWGYSTVLVAADDSDTIFEHPTIFLTILGVFVKSIPSWIRLVHVFNYFQMIVWTLDLLLLPECNGSLLRWIIFITEVLWWLVVFIGFRARKKLAVPAYLFDPVRPGSGFFREIKHLVKGFGP